MDAGAFYVAFAVGREEAELGEAGSGRGDCDPDGADWLLGRAAAGPGDAGLTSVFHIYNTMNNPGAGGMPVASVLSLLLFMVISLVLALNKRLSKLWVSYDY